MYSETSYTRPKDTQTYSLVRRLLRGLVKRKTNDVCSLAASFSPALSLFASNARYFDWLYSESWIDIVTSARPHRRYIRLVEGVIVRVSCLRAARVRRLKRATRWMYRNATQGASEYEESYKSFAINTNGFPYTSCCELPFY